MKIFMETTINPLILTLVLVLICSFCSIDTSQGQLLSIVDELEDYIVHVQRPEGARLLSARKLRAWHESFLPNKTLGSGEPRLLYSYQNAISGFAARLTAREAKEMEAKDGFVMARLDKSYPLATTYTPLFLGLSQGNGVWNENKNQGEGVIIGVLDTGIISNHPSFRDDGMPSPPVKWKGACANDSGITCNKKIIGAVGYGTRKTIPATDEEGHGTHVAGTAAGVSVEDANVLGLASGVASGTAPRAHLAIYKVCQGGRCYGRSILAGIDQAIIDEVNIISLSIGGTQLFDDDDVVLGSIGAYLKGITPVVAAGNEGPGESTVTHEAPWVLTVGAASTDRRIRATVVLGNGEEYHGESGFQPSSFDSSSMLPIAYPGEFGDNNALHCKPDSLKNFDVEGKVVLCLSGESTEVLKGKEVLSNGGAAMIVMNLPIRGDTTNLAVNWVPASHLTAKDSDKVLDYYNSSKSSQTNATATIKFGGTVFGHRPAPSLPYFSSRGPAKYNGGILKPDVLAPGVNILAAWYEEVGPDPTGTLNTFAFESGTSMSTPHVSGIVALVKSKYPEWTPSVIQSAIITSARNADLDGNAIYDDSSYRNASIFAVGAGHISASGALDPGLVYDIKADDFVRYVCGLGIYTNGQVSLIFQKTVDCSSVDKVDAWNLNYPSITLYLEAGSGPVTVRRTVTNYGDETSWYKARIVSPDGVSVNVSAEEIQFTEKYEECSFSVTFSITSGPGQAKYSNGLLEWISDDHVVTSPIAINWV